MTANKTTVLTGFKSLNACVLLICSLGHAWANPPADAVMYTVKPGDTINNLAQRLLTPPPNIAELQQANQIRNLDRIGVGQVLLLPRGAIRFTPSFATVRQINCSTTIVSNNQAVEVGQKLSEGALVEIPSACSMGLELEDGSIVRVPAGGRLQINMLRTNVLESAPVIRLQITRGRVEVSVNKGAGRTAPFEISTPSVVMGVRGTEFRVGHTDDGNTSQVEVLSGQVGVGSRDTSVAEEKKVPAGRGVVVDAKGGTLADEALLPGPTLEVTDTTQHHWRLKIDPTTAASRVWVRESQLASFSDLPATKLLGEREFWIHKPNLTATFFESVGESAAGLRGQLSRYGVCAAENNRCNVVFGSPFAQTLPITLKIEKLNESRQPTVVLSRTLRSADGLYLLAGLPLGHYRWVISAALTKGQSPVGAPQESGEFVLVGGPAPRKP